MNNRQIILKKVKTHNLKEVDLTLDPFELIVFTGVSGSGKSSLAFDTIYVEGQRRYIESLESSVRRYVKEFKKVDAKLITGLSPTIAIEQKTVLKTPRSTVGTMSGVYDFLRVLFSKIGIAHCPISKEVVRPESREKILSFIEKNYLNKKLIILSPSIKNKKGSLKDDILDLQKKGFTKLRIDQEIYDIEDIATLDPKKEHNLDIVIDRIKASEENLSRLKEDLNLALNLSKGSLVIMDVEAKREKFFSEFAFSPKSEKYYPPLTSSDFSFNHPSGMCEKCQGLGDVWEFDIDKIIDDEKSISEDCCAIAGHYNTVRYKNIYDNLARIFKFDVKTKWKNLSKKAKDLFLNGSDEKWIKMKFIHPRRKVKWTEFIKFKGIIFEAHKRIDKAKSDLYRKNMQKMMSKMICPVCSGAKIKPYPAATTINGLKIDTITSLTISEALDFFKNIKLSKEEKVISKDLLFEIIKKLNFLINVGLHYISLDRISPTLSGGESQRVRLASQIGSALSGATYILDEPSIGLHPHDHSKLIDTLLQLKEEKNTIIVVEHDRDTIEAADTIVDVGPFAGKIGGEIIAKGTIEDIIKEKKSITGKYLSGERSIKIPKKRKISKEKIKITNCTHNNLKNITLKIPLHNFTCITGVSGSGKSSLISDTLFPALSNELNKSNLPCGKFKNLSGLENVEKAIFVDQSPIGRTIRSNPATYTKLFDDIRALFAKTPLSKIKGFSASHFSFNVKEGTCSYCRGLGKVKVDMDFMEDVFSTCIQCKGKRFDPEILSITYKDKNIFDVLNMDIEEASIFFENIYHIKNKLDLLKKVGLGYLPLGQSATTLSGGEAQRIKLARELMKPNIGKSIYILDEPTTGLHFYDIENLLHILQELVNHSNTVIVIEHNMDFIKTADHIIDIGPKAGIDGGEILSCGSVEDIKKQKTPTGIALQKVFKSVKFKTKPRKKKQKKYPEHIIIEKANQNNLKNVSIKIPHNKMTVFTGPSGSGKTSLAFDTIFQEGQLRYMEALDGFAKQYLNKLQRPKVERIDNLFPPIALEQRSHHLNPRSTIGTITEIYDHLRILYSHLGVAYCPESNEEIKTISKEYVANKILTWEENEKIQILTPVLKKTSDSFESFKTRYSQLGYLRIRLNNKYYTLDEDIPYTEGLKNEIYLVIDRLKISKKIFGRLLEAIESATKISDGIVVIAKEKEDVFFNLAFAVEKTGKSYPKITPQTFSFNSEEGMCLNCFGLGFLYGIDILSDETFTKASIIDLAFIFFEDKEIDLLEDYFNYLEIDIEIPIKELQPKDLNIFFNGSDTIYTKKNISYSWKGFNKSLQELAKHSSRQIKEALIPKMEKRVCLTCSGQRLNPLARNVKIKDVSITDFCSYSVDQALVFSKSIKLEKDKKHILEDTLKHITNSLSFLKEIGLSYISLDRSAPTLSGGELQRIKLAKQLGSYLTSCIYILDEPTIGLHPHNTAMLISALKKLKDLGNTLILVEHEPSIIKEADFIVDFGPKAGRHGGEITAKGSLNEILKNPNSLTGKYLSNKLQMPLPEKRRDTTNKALKIKKAKLHNLKNINLKIPLSAITSITGVSGSGKSTLILDILKKAAIAGVRNRKSKISYMYGEVEGIENFDKVIFLDQSPVGKTIRSDVGTYSEITPILRSFYASLLLSKTKGLKPGNFSYNHIRGMCRTCWGLGFKNIQLQFLPPIKVKCPSCNGFKLNPISLEVKYKNKHLGNILDLTIDEAKDFFEVLPKFSKKIKTLQEVGLGYLKVGQELQTLSGGEAQRLRLAKELSKRQTTKTLYLFDEPTIGLHNVDIEKLLKIFHRLADKKNTLIIIEHNLDIIANSDYIIDIGPEAGEKGGKIIAKGTINEFIKNKDSYTAKYLKEYLKTFK